MTAELTPSFPLNEFCSADPYAGLCTDLGCDYLRKGWSRLSLECRGFTQICSTMYSKGFENPETEDYCNNYCLEVN